MVTDLSSFHDLSTFEKIASWVFISFVAIIFGICAFAGLVKPRDQ